MASNLVSYLMQFLTPDTIARLAAALGLDVDKVQRGVAAAVPAVLAGLASTATQPGGAEKIADAARQQSGVLDNLGGLLSGGNPGSLAQTGTQLLSSIFGGNSNALANAVGNYSGLGTNGGGSLLGMLAPLVLGGIAKKMGSDTSASGIAGLLASEKDNIAAALPPGLKDMLASSGLLGSLGGTARSAASAGSDAAARAAATATSAARQTSSAATATASRGSNWLYWLIGALALLAILYYLFGRPAQQTAETAPEPTPPAQTETQPAPAEPQPQTQAETPAATPAPTGSIVVGGVDVGKQVTDTLASLQTALSGVTDAATAQSALPQLQTATGAIDQVSGMLGQLSAEQKASLAALAKPSIDTLNALFDKVLAIPGVSDILKPAIDALRPKLAALAA
ncbi:DUF937 domain-containing protein [Mycoplana rhizolycopersici]|uniref:DUF937 domain-containing protein n=1 Tax=Mycoplana rhizolycopersici TaxID=2746702 RepID=A0ABX2QEY4_9HYPH|nr:DUF937 domain-containing protein [Rhizobium rhizolycopersici]NVP56331.1 DUF937 domain-containing protein [Rhizobium rhizolycopersici]